jgi:hypothetical protein
MTNPIIHLHNLETGEIIEREMNAEELAQHKKDQVAQANAKAEAEAKTAQRQEILDKLGLTADEAQLLLG